MMIFLEQVRRKARGLLSLVALLWSIAPSHAASLAWDANSEPDLAGYKVYIQSVAGTYVQDVGRTELHPLTNLVAGVSYSFYVTAYNTEGVESEPSEVLPFTVPHLPPVIVYNPSSLTVEPGQPFSLTVQASGSGDLRYQWLKNGAEIPGATSAAFSISTSDTIHSGSYCVRVSNQGGTVTSGTADVTVLSGKVEIAPVIVKQPLNVVAYEGSSAQISVELQSGTGFLQYEWWKDGKPVPGAFGPTIFFSNIQLTDAGTYYVRISSAAGTIVSGTSTVTVLAGPRIVQAPQPVRTGLNSPVTFTVAATGANPLTYQWFKNGQAISGATAASYALASARISDAGQYHVTVSNAAGSVSSQPVELAVLNAPQIVSQPVDVSVGLDETGSLAVQATGTELKYQWFKGLNPVVGGTTATLTFQSAQYSDSGEYTVVVSNAAGSVTSEPATFSVGSPRFLGTLASTSVPEGAAVALTVSNTGEQPITYQWFKDGQLLSGKTNAVLSISAAKLSDTGMYSLRASNKHGSTVSTPALLEILAAPRIVVQPASRDIPVGGSGVLNVEALGSAPMSYQWLRNGTPISGATSASLSIANASAAETGSYSVRISNPLGSVTSVTAKINVVDAPKIVTQPVGGSIREGASHTIFVIVNTSANVNYQWFRNGELLSGANSAGYVISSAKAENAGTYTVRVSNSSGGETSAPAVIEVIQLPKIVRAPAAVSVNEGALLSLSVEASGTGPLAYQWLKNGTSIAGATSASFAVNSATAADAANYSVRVSNAAGNVTSGTAAVTVVSKPRITLQPVGATVKLGANVTLIVQASGSGNLVFQWFKDGLPASSTSSPLLMINSVKESDFGAYTVRVFNSAGSVESQVALVEKLAAPVITAHPASLETAAGTAATLSVTATGSGTLSYQWYKDQQPVSGATSSQLSFASISAVQAGSYNVRVSNSAGQVESSAAQVKVLLPVQITTEPVSLTVQEGAAFTLSVQATGSGVLTYQWTRNGTPIAGATGASFSVAAASLNDGGTYAVTVRNSVSAVTSASATVTIQKPVTEPDMGVVRVKRGSDGNFSFVGTGIPGRTYEVQTTSKLGQNNWTTIQTVVVEADGTFAIVAADSSVRSMLFVRVVRVN